ncbi:MAG: hypothetical protein QM736_04695 [Vicinamibacterales bacterium]
MMLLASGIAIADCHRRVAIRLAMSNEFYSRGITETWVTTGVLVVAVAIGFRDVAPALAVVVGTERRRWRTASRRARCRRG